MFGSDRPDDGNGMAKNALRIVGGHVIDPANGASRVRDVLVHDGRVVDALPERADVREVDARGMLVLPAGIDMHAHVVSRGVAVAREVMPELVPAAEEAARRYLAMGWTTVVDAAVPIADTVVACSEAAKMRPMNVRWLLELGVHGMLIETLDRHGDDAALDLVATLLKQSGAYGIKLVNPGHVEHLDAPIEDTQVTPRRLIAFAARAVGELGLAHPLHLHAPDLGELDSVGSTVAALDATGGERVHLAHAQFYAYREDERGNLSSAAAELAAYLKRHEHVTIDSGCVLLGEAVAVTRDHPLMERLEAMSGAKRTYKHDWSVMPLWYDADDATSAVQWAIGLELILRCEDLERVALSVDHPNGGPFWRMPELLRLLGNREARAEAMARVHPAARERTGLAGIDRELTNEELVVLTRVAPAKSLGLVDRGHLGSGSVADVVVTEAVDAQPRVVVVNGEVL